MKSSKILKKPMALLLGLLLCLGCISPVETYAAGDGTPTTLDISKGSITIGADAISGYDASGNAVTAVDEDGYIITGTATTTNTITVNGGNPTITFSGLNITRTEDVTNTTPILTVNSDATLKLVGSNTINSGTITTNDGSLKHNSVRINSGATLTVNGSGSLTMTSAKKMAVVTGDGTFVVESGTVTLAFGDSNWSQWAVIDVNTVKLLGGSLTLNARYGHSGVGRPATVENFIISGGVLTATSNSVRGMEITNFTMTGGTVNSITLRSGGSNFITATTATITGGNVNSYYSAAITGRTLTTLAFGTSYANKTVYVSEDGVNYWSAKANADGEIITYLDENTKDVYVKTSATGSANTMKLLALGADYAGKEVLVSADGTSYWSATADASGNLLVYLGDADTASVKLNGTSSDPVSINLSNSWTVIVPANLTAGGAAGTVSLTGTWAANQTAVVAADENITLTCDLNSSDTTNVAVTFDGISQAGGIAAARTEAVSAAAPTDNIIFGTWTGQITYSVNFTSAALTGITATVKGDTVYAVGDTVSKDDVIVVATYANGGTQVVSDYTVDSTPVTATTTSVTVSYTEGDVTKTVSAPVKVVTDITITKAPSDTEYTYGDEFKADGMEVTVTYANGSKDVLSGSDLDDLTITPTKLEPTSGTTADVTITYKGEEATQTVGVNPIPTSITLPADFETEYGVGDTVDPGTVTVTYSNGTTQDVTDYTVEPATIAADTEKVTITYTDDTTGETATTDVAVKVVESISSKIKADYEDFVFYHGDPSSVAILDVTVTYTDGTSKTIDTSNPNSGLSYTPTSFTDHSVVGDAEMTLTYKGATTTQTVPLERKAQELHVTLSNALAGAYFVYEGDSFDRNDITAAAIEYCCGDNTAVEDLSQISYTPTGVLTASDLKIEFSYNGLTDSVTVIYQPITGLAVTKAPTTTVYNYGDTFDSTGMEVTVTYSDGTTKVLKGDDLSKLTITPETLEPRGSAYQTVVISYNGNTTEKDVTVLPDATDFKVSINGGPFYEDDAFSSDNISGATVVYENDYKYILSTSELRNIRFSPYFVTADTSGITFRFDEPKKNKEVTTTVSIDVIPITSIAVTKEPTKTVYTYGDTFDSTGMEVTAIYRDGTTKVLSGSDLTLSNTTLKPASGTTQDVTIRYNGLTTTQTVTANTIPVSITLPADFETEYAVGDTVDPGTVNVTYSNGTKKSVADYTVTPSTVTDTTTSVTVSYTDATTGKTATVSVPVKVVTGLSITTAPTKTKYNWGATFDSTGMEVTVTYSDGTTKILSGSDLTLSNTTLKPASGTTADVTISYKGKKTTQTVTVTPNAGYLTIATTGEKITGTTAVNTRFSDSGVAGEGGNVTVTVGTELVTIQNVTDVAILYVNCGDKNREVNAVIKNVATVTSIHVNNSYDTLLNVTIESATGGSSLRIESNSNVIVKGGYFTLLKIVDTTSSTVTITGGTFDFDPTAYVPTGYTVTQSGSTWTVTANA